MERLGNPAIPLYRRHGGPGPLIATRFGGRGATPLQAVRAQRSIACHSPSLAAAIIPADTPGIERRLFWRSPILAGVLFPEMSVSLE
jgi:hypothetical protein